jgi:Flp pilus assembly protein TadD
MSSNDAEARIRMALRDGHITVAEALCSKWRCIEPACAEAHHLSGVAALHQHDWAQALSFFSRAVELDPRHAKAWCNLGIAGRQAGRDCTWVIGCLGKALELLPDNIDIRYNLALLQHDCGLNQEGLDTLSACPQESVLTEKIGWLKASILHALKLPEDAKSLMEDLVERFPARHDFWRALGDLAAELREVGQAEFAYRRALDLAPGDIQSQRGLGNFLVRQGRPAEGKVLLGQVLESTPDRVEAHVEYAQALTASGVFVDAQRVLETAVGNWPENAELYFNLGLVHGECGNFKSAESNIRKAIQLNANLYLAHNYLGVLLEKTGQVEEAERSYRQAIALSTDFAEAYNNLANLLAARLELQAAEGLYLKSIEANGDFAEAHHNLGLLLLLCGRYEDGWREYAWRWKTPDCRPHLRVLERPEWSGQDIAGKRILVHAEQGYGDTIQFVRYMSSLAESGAEVIFETPPQLERLLRGLSGIGRLFRRGEPIPDHDYHAPLLNIPELLGTRTDNIPNKIPYIFAEEERTKRWRERLAGLGEGLRIGIVWAGNPKHARDRQRSLPVGELSRLAGIERVNWISLYKSPSPGTGRVSGGGLPLVDWTGELGDYADTAALIAGLDLVIAVDTSVAHLAGAMGKPVWIMLPYAPDWRWVLGRKDSPWYSTATLYRQRWPEDWEGVLAEIRADLRQMCEKKAP